MARLRKAPPEPKPSGRQRPSERYANLKVYPGGMTPEEWAGAPQHKPVPLPEDNRNSTTE